VKTFLQFWPWLYSPRNAEGAIFFTALWIVVGFIIWMTIGVPLGRFSNVLALVTVFVAVYATYTVWSFYREDVAFYGGVKRHYNAD
jgi:uncharacterized membrane protein